MPKVVKIELHLRVLINLLINKVTVHPNNPIVPRVVGNKCTAGFGYLMMKAIQITLFFPPTLFMVSWSVLDHEKSKFRWHN